MAETPQNAPSSQEPAEGADDVPPPTPGSPRTEDQKDEQADDQSIDRTGGN